MDIGEPYGVVFLSPDRIHGGRKLYDTDHGWEKAVFESLLG